MGYIRGLWQLHMWRISWHPWAPWDRCQDISLMGSRLHQVGWVLRWSQWHGTRCAKTSLKWSNELINYFTFSLRVPGFWKVPEWNRPTHRIFMFMACILGWQNTQLSCHRQELQLVEELWGHSGFIWWCSWHCRPLRGSPKWVCSIRRPRSVEWSRYGMELRLGCCMFETRISS